MSEKNSSALTTIHRYREAYQGKFESKKLDEHTASLERLLATEKVFAKAFITSFVIVQDVSVQTKGGDDIMDICVSTTGGACTGGSGVTMGDIYTEDMSALLKNTAWIGFFAAAAYLHIDFYDKDHKIIGHFEGGGVSSVIGGGGGGAKWYSSAS
jgi:hypothetical protein